MKRHVNGKARLTASQRKLLLAALALALLLAASLVLDAIRAAMGI